MKNDKKKLMKAIETAINKFSIENYSNTPDYILAEYLVKCLNNFEDTVVKRDNCGNFSILKKNKFDIVIRLPIGKNYLYQDGDEQILDKILTDLKNPWGKENLIEESGFKYSEEFNEPENAKEGTVFIEKFNDRWKAWKKNLDDIIFLD